MFRTVTIRLVFINFYLKFLSIDNKVDALTWPKCGEFVFPADDINLSAEERQFRRKLPALFEPFDKSNSTDIENTLRTLKKFNVSFASERKNLAKQTLSPTIDIVSNVKSNRF